MANSLEENYLRKTLLLAKGSLLFSTIKFLKIHLFGNLLKCFFSSIFVKSK